mmetsp:Transcript_3340/g.4493  ORF Transcript_3340/g.4493 Transcript_3340/m.4493 type:complete len:457 (-) Transcript_3340:587-1957(-)
MSDYIQPGGGLTGLNRPNKKRIKPGGDLAGPSGSNKEYNTPVFPHRTFKADAEFLRAVLVDSFGYQGDVSALDNLFDFPEGNAEEVREGIFKQDQYYTFEMRCRGRNCEDSKYNMCEKYYQCSVNRELGTRRYFMDIFQEHSMECKQYITGLSNCKSDEAFKVILKNKFEEDGPDLLYVFRYGSREQKNTLRKMLYRELTVDVNLPWHRANKYINEVIKKSPQSQLNILPGCMDSQMLEGLPSAFPSTPVSEGSRSSTSTSSPSTPVSGRSPSSTASSTPVGTPVEPPQLGLRMLSRETAEDLDIGSTSAVASSTNSFYENPPEISFVPNPSISNVSSSAPAVSTMWRVQMNYESGSNEISAFSARRDSVPDHISKASVPALVQQIEVATSSPRRNNKDLDFNTDSDSGVAGYVDFCDYVQEDYDEGQYNQKSDNDDSDCPTANDADTSPGTRGYK